MTLRPGHVAIEVDEPAGVMRVSGLPHQFAVASVTLAVPLALVRATVGQLLLADAARAGYPVSFNVQPTPAPDGAASNKS